MGSHFDRSRPSPAVIPSARSTGTSSQRWLQLSRAVRHPDGRSPVFGDHDSGRVLPAGFARSPTHDHVVWLAAALLGQDRPFATAPHEEVAWTLGISVWRRLASRPVRPAPARRAFPNGGVHVLGAGESHLVVRCGGVGQNGFGGHAHNDISSFELSLGELLVIDCRDLPTPLTSTSEMRSAARAHTTCSRWTDGRSTRSLPRNRFAFRPRSVPHRGVGVRRRSLEADVRSRRLPPSRRQSAVPDGRSS